jgi:hypothetical protein
MLRPEIETDRANDHTHHDRWDEASRGRRLKKIVILSLMPPIVVSIANNKARKHEEKNPRQDIRGLMIGQEDLWNALQKCEANYHHSSYSYVIHQVLDNVVLQLVRLISWHYWQYTFRMFTEKKNP